MDCLEALVSRCSAQPQSIKYHIFDIIIVQVYNTETGEWDLWRDLIANIWGHSCTRVGDKVVIAGGVNIAFTIIATTTILDLNTRREQTVGNLHGARAWFGMATIDNKVLAFGGMSPLYRNSVRDQYNDIQELDMESGEWTVTDNNLATTLGISSFATAVVYTEDVCK